MGWLTGSLVACCTVSLVVGSNGALSNLQTDGRLSNTHNTNERFPILPRRKLSLRNDASVLEKSVYTTRTSTVPTDSTIVTPTEMELSLTSTLKKHSFPSRLPSPASLSDMLLEPSSNVPSTSSTLNSSGVVPHSTTKVSIAPPIISALTAVPTHTWESEQVHPVLSGFASSIKPSRAASSLAATPEPKPSLGDSFVSTLLQDVVSSQTVVAQPPIITSALVYSLSDSLPTNVLSTTYSGAQRQWNQSTTSRVILSPTVTHYDKLLESESAFAPSSTAVVSSQQIHHVDAPPETSSASSNSGTALSTLSGASKTAAGLQEYLVSSLASWAPLISSPAGAGGNSGTEVATGTATTLTKIIPQQTASAPKVVENFFKSTTPAPNNTSSPYFSSAVRSEGNATGASWLSLVFTQANPQTAVLSTPVPSAKLAIPTTSNLYTNSSFFGVVPTASQIATPQSVTSSTWGPYTTSLQGDSYSLHPGTYPTSAYGNDEVSSRAKSYLSLQMMQTGVQSAPILAPFATLVQTPTPTRTVEIANTQYASNSISSPTTSLPCSSVSTAFVGWANTSTPEATGESAAFSQPAISTGLGTNSSASPLVLWYMNRTSSLPSTTKLPPVSKYMEISSFVTRTRTLGLEPSSQTILVASDVNTTVTTSLLTALLPMHIPTERPAATSSPPLTTSETAGVAIGGTAGLLLAIVAAVFVARRYYAARSARYDSDRSSGAYPQLAYLYDPSLGGAESDNGRDDDASTLMSGGVTGRPFSPTRSRTPPPPPHNSVDFGHRRIYSSDSPYSDPGNPFTDTEDPFLEWTSSDAISQSSDTRFALAAAVARYSNGPQKPLPPVPDSISTHAFRDHVIPSPTLSPITNGCGSQPSFVRSSSRSSVQSQRSLRKFHCSSLSNSSSRGYGRGTRHSLTSIHEADSHHRISDLIEHDLLLPVDARSETSDSVVVYASTLTSKSLTQHSLPMPFTNNPVPMSSREGTLHSNPPAGDSTQRSPRSSIPSAIKRTVTGISYADFPSPPTTTTTAACTPTHRGWDEIKRTSADYTILISPLSPLSPSSFSPNSQPPPPPPPALKDRSLINLSSPNTRLSGISTTTTHQHGASLGHRSIPAPLRIKTRFDEGERRGEVC